MDGIKIKNPTILRVLMSKLYCHWLIDIVCFVASEYGLFMTEAFRYKRHKYDVHATDPCRGIDLRFRVYRQKEAYEIMDRINNTWQYNHKRPELQCCVIHGKGNEKHLHIQTHPNTIKR